MSYYEAGLALDNDNSCCGMFELNLGINDGTFDIDPAALTKFKARMLKMAKLADCTSNNPAKYGGVRGAGVVIVNVIIKTKKDGVEDDLGALDEVPAGETQLKLVPYLVDLGFRRVKTYLNPRSGNTLRMYYTTGAELYAALVK